jgi:pimeloyl-ACP methyl ester carboxylesterase
MYRPASRSRINIAQGQVFWRESGDGKPLVLLHGGWSDSTQWRSLSPELSQFYRCYLPDLPGFGDSTLRPGQKLSIGLYVEALDNFLNAINLKQVHLVGYALGSWIAASYALRFPHKVNRLILIEPEGVMAPDQAWLCRWGRRLAAPTSAWAGLLETIAPLGGMGGPLRKINHLLTLRHQIMESPLAGELLYARRFDKLQKEMLDSALPYLQPQTFLLQRSAAPERSRLLSERYAALCYNASVQVIPTSNSAVKQAKLIASYMKLFIEKDMPRTLVGQPVSKPLPQAAYAKSTVRKIPARTPLLSPVSSPPVALQAMAQIPQS